MAPCLSKLPSVCLEAIFKHVPLSDLFYSVGLVCTSWHKSRRTALLRRRRLGLIQCKEYDHETLNNYRVYDCSYATELIERVRRDDGSPWHTLESLEKYKFNCLSVPGGVLAVSFIASLTDNFANITRLHVKMIRINSVLTQLIRLIEHNSQHLVELKIGKGFYLENGSEDAAREHALNIANLFDSINRLQSLRHLNLRLHNLRFRPPPLSCLARLTTFFVYFFGGNFTYDWIIASIKQYAQNVTSIVMYNQVDIREMFDAQLARKFIVLNVEFDEDDENDEDFDRMQAMNQFCTQFSSLTKLTLLSIFDPMTKLARYLSLLTQLVHLDLYFHHIPPIEEVQPLVEEEAEEGEGEDDEQGQEEAQQQITQVLSVRLLTIRILIIQSHRDSERLFIPEIFPNIQVLRLNHDIVECSDCEIRPVTDDSDNSDDEFGRIEQDTDRYEQARRIAECKRLTRQPFRHCANLHTVALVRSGKETLISLDDL